MKCEVTAVSRAPSKEEFARSCGADKFIASSSKAAMQAAKGSFDLVLNTIPVEHDYTVYSRLLAKGGKQIMLGLNSGLVAGMLGDAIVCGQSKVKGSGIGGIQATQSVIDFCDHHKIYPETKTVPVEEINKVYEVLVGNNDSGLRYVIDIEGSLNEGAMDRCTSPPPNLGPKPKTMGPCTILGAICSFVCCCKWCC